MVKLTTVLFVLFGLMSVAPVRAQDYNFVGLEFKTDGAKTPLIDGQFEKTWPIDKNKAAEQLQRTRDIIAKRYLESFPPTETEKIVMRELLRENEEAAKEFTPARVGVFAWVLSNDPARGDNRWTEIYAGPTFMPRKWIEIQIGAGGDSNHKGRLGAGVYLGGHLGNGMLAMEQGGSGFWYKTTYSHHVAGPVALGIFSRRFGDTGPLVEVKLSKGRTLWFTAGPNLENGKFTTITGLNIGLP